MLERMGYTVIALVLSIYLLNLVVSLGQASYGSMLLNGISVFLVVASVILILTIAYNILSSLQKRPVKIGKG